MGVAGTKVPALIERWGTMTIWLPSPRVLPELKFRPSLSVADPRFGQTRRRRVAGTKVPALIERTAISTPPRPDSPRVAGTKVPALIERGVFTRLPNTGATVLPELKFRPSLSVELPSVSDDPHPRVAGTKVPALIERRLWGRCAGGLPGVLPELKFRPSLSASCGGSGSARTAGCCRN